MTTRENATTSAHATSFSTTEPNSAACTQPAPFTPASKNLNAATATNDTSSGPYTLSNTQCSADAFHAFSDVLSVHQKNSRFAMGCMKNLSARSATMQNIAGRMNSESTVPSASFRASRAEKLTAPFTGAKSFGFTHAAIATVNAIHTADTMTTPRDSLNLFVFSGVLSCSKEESIDGNFIAI